MRPLLAALTLALVPARGLTGDTDPAVRLLERAIEIEQRGPALAEIWPGYWPPGQPFVLYLPEVGATFGGEASPGGATFREGPLEDVRFWYVLDYPGGPANTVALRLETADSNLDTLFHEQFHDFQSDAFRWLGEAGGEFVDISALDDLETFTARVEIERHLLREAISATTDEARQSLVRLYLAAREARLGDAPGDVRLAEDHMEWSEGTAEYAATMAMTVMEAAGATSASRIAARLSEPLFSPGQSYTRSVFRGRAYGVGAAQAWLLDAVDAPDWRRRVEAGQPLAQLLAEHFARGDLPPAAAPPVDDDLRAEVRRQLAALPPAPTRVAEVLADGERWLELVVDVPASRAADLGVSFRSDFTALADGLALNNVDQFLLQIDDLRVEARDRRIVLASSNSAEDRHEAVYFLELTAAEARTFEAQSPLPSFPTLELPAEQRAIIEADGDRVTVRLTL
ncbi:MAG TPA: hypothetical protein VGN74_04080 [Brevundimonas sp.]|jgi:hypothetical protein|uniref:hypothetical protein n=1 Tax=Brevundimonas sp. TaxID=1871086 RepID=UPI002E118175|nr:hypothetical protein [Brevundimonas sp.]